MTTTVEWARLHHGDEQDETLSLGWHLWARPASFPPEFGPGFRYLVTSDDGQVRTTNTLAEVQDVLDFTDVESVSAAYTVARRRFGRGLGVRMSREEWLAEPYNVERAATGRLFVAWTYQPRRVGPVEVGDFRGTFTGWKRLDPPLEIPDA
jgi:hypothetical protein